MIGKIDLNRENIQSIRKMEIILYNANKKINQKLIFMRNKNNE